MAINTNYNNYSTLFNTTTSTNNNYNDIYKLISSNTSASRSSYGKNSAPALPQKTQDFLVQAKSASETLKSALSSLSGNTKTGASSFDEKISKSSNEEYLTVKSTDSKKSTTDAVNVDIEQLATSQKNVGDKVNAADKDFSSGKQTFEVEVGGVKTVLSINTSSADTNKVVQQKMAEAINAKKLGVTATVSSDTSDTNNVKTSLTLESNVGVNKAGQNNFSIRDYSGSNLVAKFGVAAVDQQAQNAKFKVDGGVTKESKSNDADLGNGITATLKKVTTSSVSITTAKDPLPATNKIREMINGFNSLLEATNNNEGDRRTDNLNRELEGLSKSYSTSLARIGISTNKSGYLQIDEEKMKKAAESGELEKFVTSNGKNTSYGFTNRLAKKADEVSKNTTDYATTKATNTYSSTFNQTKYNSLMNTGLLFSSMF